MLGNYALRHNPSRMPRHSPATAVIQAGETRFEGAAETVYEIGSITKAFTGVLLADMVLRGEVGFDDPLSRHLERPRPAWRHRDATLLELATHRSGLANAPKALSRRELAFSLGLGRRDPWAGVSDEEYAALVGRESPRGMPGRRWRYSSMGFGLLGDALAARAG